MPHYVENIFLAAFFFPSAAVVLVFSMKYVSAVLQARVRLGQEEAYRELALKSTALQSETAAALSSFAQTLGAIQSRLAVVEKILREVE